MPHQQKLVHIHESTSVGAAGNVGVVTGFLLDTAMYPAQPLGSLAVARQETTVEIYGADPGATSRWWTTLNWAGFNAGFCNLHVVSHVFHSICFDISSVQQQY